MTNQTTKRQTMEGVRSFVMGRREERTGADELGEDPSFRTMDVPHGRNEP